MSYAPITDKEEHVARAIVEAAYTVHNAFGPGLLENVYEVCFCHELTKRGLSYRRQVVAPINFNRCIILSRRLLSSRPRCLGPAAPRQSATRPEIPRCRPGQ